MINTALKPLNPYIAGRAIKDKKGFFGRQDVFNWIFQKLEKPGVRSLALYGQRRIGKTSLLLQMKEYLSQKDFLPIFFDLQGRSRDTLKRLLSDLSVVLAESVGIDSIPDENIDDEGSAFVKIFLPEFMNSLPLNRRVIILFDEFDSLDLDPDATSLLLVREFFYVLRQSLVEFENLCLVVSLGRSPEELSLDLNLTLDIKSSFTKELWTLDKQSATEIICQAEVNNTLRFTKKAIERILELTNCHPYLTQLLCQRIWVQAYAKTHSSIPLVDDVQVNNVIPDVLETGDPALRWLWEGLSSIEKMCCATLANLSRTMPVISEKALLEAFQATYYKVRIGEIVYSMQSLSKKHILQARKRKQYIFLVELFRLWITGFRLWDDVASNLISENINKKKLDVFLCHSSNDKTSVRALYKNLCRDSFDAWLDEEKIIPGQDWDYEIEQAVRNANIVIVCLSRNSVEKSGYLQKEIKQALDIAEEKVDGEIFIIPVRLEECEVPYRLKRWQWVDLFKSEGYERLKKALRLRASQLN